MFGGLSLSRASQTGQEMEGLNMSDSFPTPRLPETVAHSSDEAMSLWRPSRYPVGDGQTSGAAFGQPFLFP